MSKINVYDKIMIENQNKRENNYRNQTLFTQISI